MKSYNKISKSLFKYLVISAILCSTTYAVDTQKVIGLGGIDSDEAYISYEVLELPIKENIHNYNLPLCRVYSHDTFRDSANNGSNVTFWKVAISLRNEGSSTLVFKDVPSASFRVNIKELLLNCSNAPDILRQISEINSNILTKDYTYEINVPNIPQSSTYEKEFNFAAIGNSPPVVTVNNISVSQFDDSSLQISNAVDNEESMSVGSVVISNALVKFRNFEAQKQLEEKIRAKKLLIEQQKQLEQQKKREAELAAVQHKRRQEEQRKKDDTFGKALVLALGTTVIGMAKGVPSDVKIEVGAALAADILMDTGGSNLLNYQKSIVGSNENAISLAGNTSEGTSMTAGCSNYNGPDDEGWIQLDSLCKRAWIAHCAIDNGNPRERESLQRSCAMYNSMRSSQGIEDRVCPYCR